MKAPCITGHLVLRWALVLLLLYTVVTAATTLVTGNISSFYWVWYNETDDCLMSDIPGRDLRAQIEVFLYERKGASGGVVCCDYKMSDSNTLEIDTPISLFKLERSGSDLKVDGKPLPKGALFQVTSVLDLNPWRITKAVFHNCGLISDCGGMNQRIVVLVDYGPYFSFSKGFLVLGILVAGLFINNQMLRRCKTRLKMGSGF